MVVGLSLMVAERQADSKIRVVFMYEQVSSTVTKIRSSAAFVTTVTDTNLPKNYICCILIEVANTQRFTRWFPKRALPNLLAGVSI
jgi:hypothetical protein